MGFSPPATGFFMNTGRLANSWLAVDSMTIGIYHPKFPGSH